MLIVMKFEATRAQIKNVTKYVTDLGYSVDVFRNKQQTLIGILEDVSLLRDLPINRLPGVERIVLITSPYKLASRSFKPLDTIVNLNDTRVGEKRIILVGIMNVEFTIHNLLPLVKTIRSIGILPTIRVINISFLKNFNYETVKELFLSWKTAGITIWSEANSIQQIDLVEYYTDAWIINSTVTHDSTLLQRIIHSGKPIILERDISATIDEWLSSAALLISQGNHNIILCECGIRTYTAQKMIDLSAIHQVEELSHLPIFINASHISDNLSFLNSVSKAAVAGGTDGLIFQLDNFVKTDGNKSEDQWLDEFRPLVTILGRIATAIDRTIEQ